jgi:hypothetical protein
MSSSAPHGASIGKYFNEIGWIQINSAGKRELDFTVKKGRISGGTANGKGDPRAEYSFAKLFGAPIPKVEGELPWMIESSFEEWKARQAARNAAAPKLTTNVAPKPTTPPATAPVTPTVLRKL